MKKKSLSKAQRVDERFIQDLQKVMVLRTKKGLANPLKRDEISIREATRLATTTESWKGVLNELSWKPKRKKAK